MPDPDAIQLIFDPHTLYAMGLIGVALGACIVLLALINGPARPDR